MKKALDQTVRDLKREVNKKVLKVPTIEQKTLDATSNEPWGPHGTKLADIAQATRNYHEYQMIMNIIWKRINDTGKNWRHVYKALTVLEYLVAHGSERVIDDIKEHAYQISTLSDFQYIDSGGRDQGSNVRRKSQSLVALVNDKERIAEVREKANANKDKFRSSFSTGKLDSYSSSGGYGDRYDDDRNESRYRDEDRYGNRREKEFNYRDDDRYNRGGDSYGREGDRYGRDADDRYSGDRYRDDDSRGRRSNDEGQYGTRNRSIDRDRSVDDDDDRHSSRSGGARVDEASKEERLDRRFSEPITDGPPSYEEVIKETADQTKDKKNGSNDAAAATIESPPSLPKESSSFGSTSQGFGQVVAGPPVPAVSNETDGFDEFDPRGAAPRVAVTSNAESSLEMDLFGSASASDSVYSLALMPIAPATADTGSDVAENLGFTNGFSDPSSVSNGMNQPGENPFGDAPFQAIPENTPAQHESFAPVTSFQSFAPNIDAQTHPSVPAKMEATTSFDFGNSFGGVSFTPVSNSQQSDFPNSSASLPEVPTTGTNNNISELLGPQAGPSAFSPPQAAQPVAPAYIQGSFYPQQATVANPAGFPQEMPALQMGNGALGGLAPQIGPYASVHTAQSTTVGQMPTYPQSGMAAPIVSQPANQFAPQNARPMTMPGTQNIQYNVLAQSRPSAPFSMEASASDYATVPTKQPSKDKFETKSTVWADTLSRGLVNLNISGPKTNPHADIGVDFESMNRRDKRNEDKKSSAAPVVSTITMGKAMGSGSGIGRAGASGLGTPPNPLMNAGMGMGVGMGMGANPGMGMNAYGMNMNRPAGMGMNMGMGQGMQMRPPIGGVAPPGTGMPGVGYNPMPGMGGYNPNQQYGGGYR